ncbi:MAG: hypothetical protein ACOC0D_09920 [Spirochaeta sp.]
MKKLGFFLMITIVAAALIGCGGTDTASNGYAPDQTVEAYAYVHGGYVGQAVVTTNDEGAIDVTLDEAFLPHTLAVVDMESDEWDEDNTVYYVSRGNEVRVAKYIAYDGTNYTGVTVGGALAYVESGDDGEPAGASILEKSIIRNEDTMKAYFEDIDDGAFQIFTEFGGDPQTVDTTRYGSLYKRGSEYWNSGDLGWSGNMEAIQEAAEENGTGYGLDEMVRRGDNRWALTDAVTSATASDFKDYFGLIQQAVGRLKM